MAALTSEDLKNYVAGGQSLCPADSVLLNFTHNLLSKTKFFEIPIPLSMTVIELKQKIYTMTGSLPSAVSLSIGGVQLADDDAPIGRYSPTNGCVVDIFDSDPSSLAKDGGLDDASKVRKYEMSDEDYDKRENTYRAFKKKMLAQDPNWKSKLQLDAEKKKREARLAKREVDLEDETPEQVRARLKVGDRCEVLGGRRGVVMHVGIVPEIKLSGEDSNVTMWVGVKFDDALGKNDGSIKGKRYFDAEGPKRGAFLVPGMVRAGDFPEVDPFDDLSDDSDVMEEL